MDPRLAPGGEAPGVPEALRRAVAELLLRIPPERIDRLWIFPPLRRGRRENGLLSASCFADGEGPGGTGRRVVRTLAYRAEETGKGVTFEPRFREEGEAPPDRLPRVMAGVARRGLEALGDPVAVEAAGEPARLAAGLDHLGLRWSPPPAESRGDGSPDGG